MSSAAMFEGMKPLSPGVNIVPFQSSSFEPIIPPLVNWWNSRPFAPRMDMHCVARSEVVTLIAAGGGRVVAVDEELVPGGFQSCTYWVIKE